MYIKQIAQSALILILIYPFCIEELENNISHYVCVRNVHLKVEYKQAAMPLNVKETRILNSYLPDLVVRLS